MAPEQEFEELRPIRGLSSSTIGFVYLLANRSLPGMYKIGCTERSPARRAGELSRSTSIPTPFDVVCYWEGECFQAFEKELHSYHDASRVSHSREFFRGPLADLVDSVTNGWSEFKHSDCTTAIGLWYLKYEEF